ncbi:MAG: RNA methyltransferase [bacterium]|nr:RNA methyltransferase [bacterium]
MALLVAVASATDPRLAPYRSLRAHDRRERDGLFVAETREVVLQLLAGRRFTPHSVLTTEAALPGLAAALDAHADLPVLVAPLDVVKAVVGFDFHRGCLALGTRRAPYTLDALRASQPRRLVVLEDVSNPDNVGGVFRAAHTLGADAVLCGGATSDPLYRKVVRVSMGAVLHLPYATVADTAAALACLRADGVSILALVSRDGDDVTGVAPPARWAVVVGNEGTGLSAASRALADRRVRIAMVPGVDSLNATVACAIALHRLA